MSRSTGAWNRLPSTSNSSENDDEDAARKSPRAVIGNVGSALQNGLAPVADRVGNVVRSGVGSIDRALDDPAKGLGNEMAEQANLPEIEGNAPLVSLGIRLDREADFWRGVSMRQLARAAWMDRLSISSSVVLLIGVVVLSAISAFRAMFASDAALNVSALIGLAALLLVVGGIVIHRVTANVRQGQLAVARDALARSDLAEARLHRLAALIEMSSVDPEGYKAALRNLENDMR